MHPCSVFFFLLSVARTREYAEARDQILSLRKVSDELDRERRRVETTHEKLVRSLGDRLAENQSLTDQTSREYASKLRLATLHSDER